MPYLFRKFLTCLSLLLFLFAFAGCDTGEKAVQEEYDKYKFDQQVIDKLPLYDSLVAAIIQNYPAFGKFIRNDDAHRSFRYIPTSENPDVFIKMPPAAVPNVSPHYSRLGDLIYGFEIFKDSSVKIFVRRRRTETKVDIGENLSYYSGANIRDREFPERDTALTRNWQYWAWFGMQDPF